MEDVYKGHLLAYRIAEALIQRSSTRLLHYRGHHTKSISVTLPLVEQLSIPSESNIQLVWFKKVKPEAAQTIIFVLLSVLSSS